MSGFVGARSVSARAPSPFRRKAKVATDNNLVPDAFDAAPKLWGGVLKVLQKAEGSWEERERAKHPGNHHEVTRCYGLRCIRDASQFDA